MPPKPSPEDRSVAADVVVRPVDGPVVPVVRDAALVLELPDEDVVDPVAAGAGLLPAAGVPVVAGVADAGRDAPVVEPVPPEPVEAGLPVVAADAVADAGVDVGLAGELPVVADPPLAEDGAEPEEADVGEAAPLEAAGFDASLPAVATGLPVADPVVGVDVAPPDAGVAAAPPVAGVAGFAVAVVAAGDAVVLDGFAVVAEDAGAVAAFASLALAPVAALAEADVAAVAAPAEPVLSEAFGSLADLATGDDVAAVAVAGFDGSALAAPVPTAFDADASPVLGSLAPRLEVYFTSLFAVLAGAVGAAPVFGAVLPSFDASVGPAGLAEAVAPVSSLFLSVTGSFFSALRSIVWPRVLLGLERRGRLVIETAPFSPGLAGISGRFPHRTHSRYSSFIRTGRASAASDLILQLG
ncbi:hypothetical protein [Aurantimonas coralicida]|uniref:hypothetical protein n=1 Tax=Aurantimonas coralicida TaxID=182270 RepID=UPI001E525159|nr:hypothetical protein [Aurantimonas coralicida]MCD1644638.1 hypothetical protein [Aurantimonas coralicida]